MGRGLPGRTGARREILIAAPPPPRAVGQMEGAGKGIVSRIE